MIVQVIAFLIQWLLIASLVLWASQSGAGAYAQPIGLDGIAFGGVLGFFGACFSHMWVGQNICAPKVEGRGMSWDVIEDGYTDTGREDPLTDWDREECAKPFDELKQGILARSIKVDVEFRKQRALQIGGWQYQVMPPGTYVMASELGGGDGIDAFDLATEKTRLFSHMKGIR